MRDDIEKQEIQSRETVCCGSVVTVYSFDSWRWYSDRREAEQSAKRHEKFLAEMRASIMKAAAFKHGTRSIGRRRRTAEPNDAPGEMTA